MIETRNLTKIYKMKNNDVYALDNIDLKLPDTGMVFILGKSGSGKSTLLNVLGGLDSFTSGEIIFKGKSISSFNQADFDSYRNTYIGFIFQEYNIIEDFNVATNIALAIELQGRKYSDEEINRILHEVELDGLGGRKPNELSGGQLQRVAIARALVKNPEIIMADEPTGALDSTTSLQIFGLLKELSKTKLVLIISHDREFSEMYADRIIELKDGHVISDTSKSDIDYNPIIEEDNENITFVDNQLLIKQDYHLTVDDIEKINTYLDNLRSDLIIGKKQTFSKGNYEFVDTNIDDISMSNEGYKLIRSRLNPKYAFRIGVSGLKHKTFKLIVAIFLSLVSFILFGLSNTMATFNERKNAISSMIDNKQNYAVISLQEVYTYGNEKSRYTSDRLFTVDKLAELKNLYPNATLEAVINGNDYVYLNYPEIERDEDDYHYYIDIRPNTNNFMRLNNEVLNNFKYKLVAGRLPQGRNEIVITKFVYVAYEKYGYLLNEHKIAINNYQDALDNMTFNYKGIELNVVGIIDTNLDYSNYYEFDELDQTSLTDQLKYEFVRNNLSPSPHCLFYISNTLYDEFIADENTRIIYTLSYINTTEREVTKLYDLMNTEFEQYVKYDYYYEGMESEGYMATYCYALDNSAVRELNDLGSILRDLGKVFIRISIFFAVFAVILLSNFIATSISYKKRDIGILRAIGARSYDVFKIFFAESLVIAAINFVLSSSLTAIICGAINKGLKIDTGLSISLLNFGIIQIVLLLALILLIAFISTIIPVYNIAKKKPIDAIKNRK